MHKEINLKKNNGVLIILGPTATGKTNLAVEIASNLNGEIISADSRQVYKGLDIGTGKDLEEYILDDKSINHHLIDIINPNENYSVYSFQRDFINSYKEIIKKNKKTILCGGTGLYIESLLLDYDLSNSPPPDPNLRLKLSKQNLSELKAYLSQVNTNIIKHPKTDTKNRIIRNIEICLYGKTDSMPLKDIPLDNYKIIGINPGRELIRKNITERLHSRLEQGMVLEVENLLKAGITQERLYYFGLEYRYISEYLIGNFNYEELVQNLNTAIHRFAKKQMTFFRRMEKRNIKINWIENNNLNEIKDFL
ncbi:MAG: tRNA (adenosine(37)-N6)-dimethylallyltransferase MiaA [Candidatus Pelagibacter sp. TMED273]|nr:MAG: tRNA (adenosine(37)-N6)-dimethylallyltransferase MiaA [Candidatus Pelagibacter sp. TMED273]|tara:strand:- start:10553 stop:11476 length:924 start_codon:yes stop_codon:yes gene_type:complete